MTEIKQFTPEWRAAMALQIEAASRSRLIEAARQNGPLPAAPKIRLQLEAGAVYAVHPRYAGDKQLPIEWGHHDLPAPRKPPRGYSIVRR